MKSYHKIYERYSFIILEGKSEYVVINKDKPFESGHTHIRNYNTALWLIKLSTHKTLPHRMSDYLLQSLIRISKDSEYVSKLELLRVKNKQHKWEL